MTVAEQMQRLDGWELRFREVLERHLEQPFEWGVSDCVVVAADVIEAITGRNLLPVRDWTTQDEAADAIRAAGGIEAALDALLPPVGVLSAQRGDLALWRQGLATALVVCDGPGFMGKTEQGRLRVPRAGVVRAWSTGR